MPQKQTTQNTPPPKKKKKKIGKLHCFITLVITTGIYVVVQFYPWFKVYFPLF